MTYHIFCGGELKDTGFISIADEDKIICADGGADHVKKLGVIPDAIIGDFDSYSGEIADGTKIIRSVPEKDDSDTMLAVRKAVSEGAKDIKMYGALGGRFDHTIANIQTLKFALDNGCHALIADYDNIITLAGIGRHKIPKKDGWYFSFFSYSEEVIVTLSGVKYPLDNALIKNNFPIGVSNEFISDEAILDIKSGTAMIVLSKK